MMPISPFVRVVARVLVRLVTLLMITSATTHAQFSIPLPSSYDVNAVRQENEQMLFMRKRDADGKFIFAGPSALRDFVNKQLAGDSARPPLTSPSPSTVLDARLPKTFVWPHSASIRSSSFSAMVPRGRAPYAGFFCNHLFRSRITPGPNSLN
jgi:hypothetical protein